MTISNERLREIATCYGDDQEVETIAAELLAAREEVTLYQDHLARLNASEAKFACQRDAAIARVEKAEAERDGWKQAAAAENEALFERNNDVERIAEERDAARAEVERLRTELAEAQADQCIRSAAADGKRIESLVADLAKLESYRDRTEAALVGFSRWLDAFGYDEDLGLSKAVVDLGLAREAKGAP